ncbi:MAG: ABC-2 family transporter protein [Chloroflexota bacterium]
MAEITYSLRLLRRLIGANFRGQLSYRLSFFFELLAVFFITLLEFASFALVLPRFGNIGGWVLGEVALLAGMVNIAFGIMDMIFSGFDPGNFGRQVRLGRMDQLLLRPANITLQVLGSEFILRRIGRILVGVGIFILALSLTEISWTAEKIALLLSSILGQILFFGALFVIGATITFWTVDSIEVINIFTYGGSEMISYPMHIYPQFLRRFFTFILPAIFLNYFPALVILGKPDPLGFPAYAAWLSFPAGLLVLIIAMRFWRFGLAHYQSTGT